MDAIDFLKTLYFGDRYCTRIILDGLKDNFELHINCISRVRDISGQWNFYNDENIENGIVVISGVKKIIFDESGLLPNDSIYNIYANKIDDKLYEFTIEANHGDEKLISHDLTIKVVGESVYLVDPKDPDKKIVS